MKPIIILAPGAMHSDGIKMLRDNGICVVVAKNPATVKFVDSVPAISCRTDVENAAIHLSRKMLSGRYYNEDTTKSFAKLYVDLLVQGTPLDPAKDEEKAVFDNEKRDEIRRLAREEAKKERAAAKAKAPDTQPPSA